MGEAADALDVGLDCSTAHDKACRQHPTFDCHFRHLCCGMSLQRKWGPHRSATPEG